MNNAFLLYHSPKPRSQVLISIYPNWSIAYPERRICLMRFRAEVLRLGLFNKSSDEVFSSQREL